MQTISGGYESVFVNGTLILKMDVLISLSKMQQVPFKTRDQIVLI